MFNFTIWRRKNCINDKEPGWYNVRTFKNCVMKLKFYFFTFIFNLFISPGFPGFYLLIVSLGNKIWNIFIVLNLTLHKKCLTFSIRCTPQTFPTNFTLVRSVLHPIQKSGFFKNTVKGKMLYREGEHLHLLKYLFSMMTVPTVLNISF